MTRVHGESWMQEAALRIEHAAVERYAARLHRYGADPRALGWDTRQNQWARFAAVTQLVDLHGRSVLDIGCGFGDLHAFLEERAVGPAAYHGIDINPALLDVAAAARGPNATFERRNLLLDPYEAPVADVAVMLGLLNFRLAEVGNYEFAEALLRAALAASREGLVVDFLSAERDPSYPEEPFVFYYEPDRILRLALSLTPRVILKHDYPSIPQREFMVWLQRASCP